MRRSATRSADRRASRVRPTAGRLAVGGLGALALVLGCRAGVAVEREGGVEAPLDGPLVRVALTTTSAAEVGSADAWRLTDARGGMLVRGARGERWRVETRGGRVRAVRADGLATSWSAGPLVARTVTADGAVALGAKRYRGELVLTPTDSGVLVVNQLPVESYLAGVVPLEIGDRPASERAAAEAQAVAARSYTYARLRATREAPFHLRAGTLDQVYGGLDAERAVANAAVRATAGQVLLFAGRPVSAPYHSTCGGTTAAPTEVWRSAAEPHLRPVSDLVPGSDRHYCDNAPRYRWTRVLEGDQLQRTLDRYLGAYAAVPAGGVAAVREVRVEETTPSGRVGWLGLHTARGVFRLRGNDIRFVLRAPNGELLNSTNFVVRRGPVRRGESAPVAVLDGRGYGHGVGMCQWGAIGRARAGQDYRTILSTYYPGTSVGLAR